MPDNLMKPRLLPLQFLLGLVLVPFANGGERVGNGSTPMPQAEVPTIDAAFSLPKLAALDAVLNAHIASGRVPCVVALLDRPGQGEHSFVSGSRDIDTGQPVRRETIFCIYSITKIVTAVAVLQLVEDGKIGLDDPVGKYLPELAEWRVWAGSGAPVTETVPADTPPTIRHLLTHTAGLYYDSTADPALADLLANLDSKPFLKSEDFLTFAAAIPLHDQPGTRYRYSIGYAVLGLVVERASGSGLEDFMQVRIFRPLGMCDTGFVVPAHKRSRLARICRHDAKGKLFIDSLSEARVPARGTFYAGGGD